MNPSPHESVRAAGPIFLAGIDRSGIGLLGDLLDAHPAFALSRRTNFWTFYDGRFGDLAESSNLDACVRSLMRYRRIRDLGLDPGSLRDTFLASPERTYARLFALIGEQHALIRGKRRWGDKSLGSERHADRILGSYPDARMVHMIRDPRDRHASVTSHRGAKRGGSAGTSAEWRDSVRLAERNAARHEQHYRVIRYEDLVAEPREVMEAVCGFFGEPLDEAVLVPLQSSHDTTPAIHALSVGRFRSDLDPGQVAFIERLLGRDITRRGYALTHPDLRPAERVLLEALTVPIGRLLMAGRRPWSKAKSRLAEPSARRLLD